MQQTQGGEVDASQDKALVSLAFRVVPDEVGLFAPQMLLLHGDQVIGKRTGLFTTLGHAIGAADDLLDGWAFNEIEQKPEEYYHAVFM